MKIIKLVKLYLREHNLLCHKHPTLYFSCNGVFGAKFKSKESSTSTQAHSFSTYLYFLFSSCHFSNADKHHGWKRKSFVLSRKVTLSIFAARFALDLFF